MRVREGPFFPGLCFWGVGEQKKQADQLCNTLFAHISPQALQRVLGPDGPRRIAGVSLSLVPQW